MTPEPDSVDQNPETEQTPLERALTAYFDYLTPPEDILPDTVETYLAILLEEPSNPSEDLSPSIVEAHLKAIQVEYRKETSKPDEIVLYTNMITLAVMAVKAAVEQNASQEIITKLIDIQAQYEESLEEAKGDNEETSS